MWNGGLLQASRRAPRASRATPLRVGSAQAPCPRQLRLLASSITSLQTALTLAVHLLPALLEQPSNTCSPQASPRPCAPSCPPRTDCPDPAAAGMRHARSHQPAGAAGGVRGRLEASPAVGGSAAGVGAPSVLPPMRRHDGSSAGGRPVKVPPLPACLEGRGRLQGRAHSASRRPSSELGNPRRPSFSLLQDVEAYKAAFASRGTATAAVNYYRAVVDAATRTPNPVLSR